MICNKEDCCFKLVSEPVFNFHVSFKSASLLFLFVCRTVLDYYASPNGTADEDAYDMRKPTTWDVDKKSIIAEKTVITSDEYARC